MDENLGRASKLRLWELSWNDFLFALMVTCFQYDHVKSNDNADSIHEDEDGAFNFHLENDLEQEDADNIDLIQKETLKAKPKHNKESPMPSVPKTNTEVKATEKGSETGSNSCPHPPDVTAEANEMYVTVEEGGCVTPSGRKTFINYHNNPW
ncbi:hypothetical protein LXL04_019902 [Taraxacum kok-saghyz]